MPTFRATPEQIEEYIRRAGATAGPSALEASRSVLQETGQPVPEVVTKEDVRRVLAKGRTRHEPGRMNKREASYAAHLDTLKAAGKIAVWWFEVFKLRLADKTWWYPDFLVMLPDGMLELHEVKGHMEDDAAVKVKVAASQYPIFCVRLVRWNKRQWVEKVVSAN